MNSDILDIEELKEELERNDSFYKEATSDIDLNGAKAELAVSVSRDAEEPNLVHIRVAGNIPIPISGKEPIIARLDRETTMDKEAFMNMDANDLRDKIQYTVLHGNDLSKEDVEKRDSEKAFSLFSDLGAKFDNLLINSKESAVKYFDSMMSTISIAKKNIEASRIGQGFVKATDHIKSGAEKVVEMGKAVAGSYDRANQAFELAMKQQTKNNEMVSGVKNRLAEREEQLDKMRAEVDVISKSLEKMTAGIEKQGFITSDQKARIDLMNDILREKTNECTYLEGSILLSEMTLEHLKEVGIEYGSPMSAAFKAQRESYFKDISSAYGTAKQAIRAEYEVGKKALSSMVDTIKEANKKSKIHGKFAYYNLEGRLHNIGMAGLAMMQAMEVKTVDFLRSRAISLSEKYQHKSEVRASAKNLLNTILYKDADAQPLLTEREVGMIRTMADLADKMEARSEKTAEKIKNGVIYVFKTEKAFYNEKGERIQPPDKYKDQEPKKEEKKAWEPQKPSEDKKVEVGKLREELDR